MAEFMEANEDPSLLELSVRDFRAIKEATIKLDGITVVTGENSTGKSTLSTLFYYVCLISENYNYFIEERFKRQIHDVIRVLIDISEYFFVIPDIFEYAVGFSDAFEDDFFKRLLNMQRKKVVSGMKEEMLSTIKEMQKEYEKEERDENDNKNYAKNSIAVHLKTIVSNFKYDLNAVDTMKQIFELLENIVAKIYQEFQKGVDDRSKDIFENKLLNIYKQRLENFSVKKSRKNIISTEDKRLEKFNIISHAIYVDSPMAVKNPEYKFIGKEWRDICTKVTKFSHWEVLDFYLTKKNEEQIEEMRETSTYDDIQDIFTSSEILNGDVVLEDDDTLIFQRNDGKNFDIEDCATGIKSIAILQTLYKNGWLTSKTLLVLDEPETHLHPQWVVEYARLIVLLHKEVGVRFFISSHHPDMVGAIKDISNKEGVNDMCRFYFAKESEESDNFIYTFKSEKRGKVNNIFRSFNGAIGKINEYGVDND